jgi:signal transduction histidine kinase
MSRYPFLSFFTLFIRSLIHVHVLAQIAPLPYTPVPAPASDAPTVVTQGTSQKEPRALIRGWSFGNELVPAVKGWRGDEIRLDPGASNVVFFFKATSPSAAPIEYRYCLENYDSGWNITGQSIAHYRRLPPSRYRFAVQAHTPGQPWNTAAAEISIVQRPFFYQTWYFYMLLLFGLIALAVELLRQRDRLLKGQIGMVLEERNRIASDCHDTLMAGFAAISWQLEATARLFAGSDERLLPAAQSCELARKMVAHCQAEARRIIWNLRGSDEITDVLSHALSLAITASCPQENIDTSFEVEGDEISIAPAAVHHLVCIGQEAVTNAVRHSGSSRIQIRLRYKSDSLNLTVRDNGRGFHCTDPGSRIGHFGIRVMHERSRKLGGTLRINTSPDTGTEVSVTVGFHSIHPLSDRQHHIVPWIGV